MNCRQLLLVAIAFIFAGCASAPTNPVLSNIDRETGYRFGALELGPSNSDDVFVIVAISGGGLRAAGLAYGVMREMAQLRFGDDQRSLLDEIDVLSTVSASSLVSGYYVTFGQEKFLENFPEDVLELNMERALKIAMLNPVNWLRMLSTRYSRSDLFEAYLDDKVFDNRRFSQLPRKRPFVIISAMDLALGTQFSFDQDHFDHLCSDLGNLSLARAVASSMAVSPYLAPIRLKNYDKSACNYKAPAWLVETEVSAEPGSRAALEARIWREYEDSENRKYVHLVDGAFADRLAIRPIERALSPSRGPWSIPTMVNLGKISKVVVISIDANVPGAGASFPKEPTIFRSISSATRRAADIYASDVSELLRLSLSSWQEGGEDAQTKESRMISQCNYLALEVCKESDCQERTAEACYRRFARSDDSNSWPEVYSINLGLGMVKPEHREWASTLRTGLRLSRRDTVRLGQVGAEVLNASPIYQRLKQDLKPASSEIAEE